MLTAALAPSLPSSSLLPPSLRGRGRVSAARRPGNAADAPRSIPGGGSARVLPHGRRGLGLAGSRRLVKGQGGGLIGLRGSRRLLPPARPRRAPGSSARRGAAGRRPRARRDLLLLKPERDSGSPGAWRPCTRGQTGGLGVSSAGSGARRPLAPRLGVSGFCALPQAAAPSAFPVIKAASC